MAKKKTNPNAKVRKFAKEYDKSRENTIKQITELIREWPRDDLDGLYVALTSHALVDSVVAFGSCGGA